MEGVRLTASGLEHVPQKWEPVLRKRTCSNKELDVTIRRKVILL